ncbi:hypothetical protein C8T65DRAFT_628304 [Cerioporus squamosus]|nr:hypothetical protein C8T65DRAFT_628304 [Cerioporus squamosus]
MPAELKRTYSTRAATKPLLPSSPTSELTSPPPPTRKRPFTDRPTEQNTPTSKQPKLTQLHFSLDTPTLRTCPLCDLSYTRGAPDDEALHKAHCARVQRGLEWGKEEQREAVKAGIEELQSNVKLRNGARGRVICFRPDIGGKIGAKLAVLLETIRLALSSPPLSPAVLRRSKIYLFLLAAPGISTREKIVGCVVAQRISTAMAIARPAEVSAALSSPSSSQTQPSETLASSQPTPYSSQDSSSSSATSVTLLPVDSSTNLYVHPQPLPTPMGIPRLFVSSEHRRLGIASRLLSAAAETFILGCPLSPARAHGCWQAVLESWGKGGVRIYEEEGNI